MNNRNLQKIIRFINFQNNKDELWKFIEFEQPCRCGWNFMYGFEELNLLMNFCITNNFNIEPDNLISYLKIYRIKSITYEEYISNKFKYNTMIFNYYYNNSFSKL